MHLSKNVLESIVGVLLDMKTKTKSHQDLVNQNIRTELHLAPAAQSGKVVLPNASYNLTTVEKRFVC